MIDRIVLDLRNQPWCSAQVGHTGVEYVRRPCARVTTRGLPHLYLFPDPFHPIEVMMAQRGWGGVCGNDDRLVEQVDEIAQARESREKLIRLAGKWLYWDSRFVHLMYHLFTPLLVNALANDPTPALRRDLHRALLLPPPTGRRGDAYGYGEFRDFWGKLVYGEIEL